MNTPPKKLTPKSNVMPLGVMIFKVYRKCQQSIYQIDRKVHNVRKSQQIQYTFFNPDYTVGFGVSPNQHLHARGLLPPIGNFTLP
jgi:hypothetical protein